jgi:cell shape-determining protein MreC
VLVFAVAGCLVLMFLPGRCIAPLKAKAADGLRPAQAAMLAARREARLWSARLAGHFQCAGESARRDAELIRLREENRQLAGQLARLRLAAEGPSDANATPRLVKASPVEARVLGRQALSFLGRAELLDVGRSSGAEAGGLVLDCGRDRCVQPGQIAIGEACVWGRIAEVGRWTSLVRRLVDAGYRDVVQIVGQRAATRGLRRGPQGVLEGTGGQLARISRVDVTEPIEVGDMVYTAAETGVLPRPVLYGQVARVERPVGSAYWEIWMNPAAGRQAPERLLVLSLEINPLRAAEPTPARSASEGPTLARSASEGGTK